MFIKHGIDIENAINNTNKEKNIYIMTTTVGNMTFKCLKKLLFEMMVINVSCSMK